MGTTLTGTTPQDTYDSLIKVTDNGPISGTLKALSDGLGNDSTLSLSTTAASIAGTLAVTGNATFDTNTLFVDAANNRVGIGTTAPTVRLQVRNDVPASTSLAPTLIRLYNESDGGAAISMDNGVGGKGAFAFSAESTGGGTDDIALIFSNSFNGSALTEQMRISSTGNVGIGTNAPSAKLHVSAVAANSYAFLGTSTNWGVADTNRLKLGSTGDTFTLGCDLRANTNYAGTAETSLGIWATNGAGTMVEVVRATANGLTFNGDTAAANALDDYEEGTWTPNLFSASGANPTFTSSGVYTKIGNVVNISCQITLTSTAGSVGYYIENMPFASSSTTAKENAYGVERSTSTTISVQFANNVTLLVTKYDGTFYGASGYIYNIGATYLV